MLRDPSREQIDQERSRGFECEMTLYSVSPNVDFSLKIMLKDYHVFCPDIDDEVFRLELDEFLKMLFLVLSIVSKLGLLR